MSDQRINGLPKVIDSLAFAKAGGVAVGAVQIASLVRLQETLTESGGQLECRLVGSRDAEGKNWLELGVKGTLRLACQRCLEGLDYPVEVETRLLLVPSGQPWPDEELAEDGFDAIAADEEMTVASLVEDEVLLALPLSPMHDVCAATLPHANESEPSPFAALAKLKKGV